MKKGHRLICIIAVALTLAACAAKRDATSGAAPGVSASRDAKGLAPDSIPYFNQVVGNTVNYDYDEYNLSPRAQEIVRRQVAWLNQNPSYSVTIQGHCDERGTREYDLALGAKRADALRNYLVALGISASRLRTISYGKERPICTASVEGCWYQNRRSVSVVE